MGIPKYLVEHTEKVAHRFSVQGLGKPVTKINEVSCPDIPEILAFEKGDEVIVHRPFQLLEI